MQRWEEDPRRAFVVGTIAGAIAPPGQKVTARATSLRHPAPAPAPNLPRTHAAPAGRLRAVHCQGRNGGHRSLPGGCLDQHTAGGPAAAEARPCAASWQRAPGNCRRRRRLQPPAPSASATLLSCRCPRRCWSELQVPQRGRLADPWTPQASVSGLGTGQLQFMLSNVPQFPPGCQYQVGAGGQCLEHAAASPHSAPACSPCRRRLALSTAHGLAERLPTCSSSPARRRS
jgi:hypothetical protein